MEGGRDAAATAAVETRRGASSDPRRDCAADNGADQREDPFGGDAGAGTPGPDQREGPEARPGWVGWDIQIEARRASA